MRPLNRVLALVLGLALAIAAVIAIVEVALLQADRQAWIVPRASWHDHLRALRWDDASLVITSAVLLVVGLILALLQLVPRLPRRLPIRTDQDTREVSVSRRALEGHLTRVAERERDVVTPKVRIRKRNVAVRAGFATTADPAEIARRLRGDLGTELERFQLADPPRVKLHLHPATRRVK